MILSVATTADILATVSLVVAVFSPILTVFISNTINNRNKKNAIISKIHSQIIYAQVILPNAKQPNFSHSTNSLAIDLNRLINQNGKIIAKLLNYEWINSFNQLNLKLMTSPIQITDEELQNCLALLSEIETIISIYLNKVLK